MSRNKGVINFIESGKWRQKKLKIDPPAFLLVEFVAHDLGELFELALGRCIVALDHDVLKMPEPPGEVLEALALFQVTSDLGADLCQCVHTASISRVIRAQT